MNNTEYMMLALEEAKKAYSENEVPIGAIVVKDGEIIGRGHNTREVSNDVTCHAEINAIREAEKRLGSYKLDGCSIYVTVEPCPMCSYAIIDSHMDNLFYGSSDEKRGAISNLDIFNKKIGKKINVCGNILEQDSKKLLQSFFKELRKTK